MDSTALIVEVQQHENRNLELSSRNLAWSRTDRRKQVHPYHLLRYDRAIFSQPAIEKLQDSLKNTLSKRQKEAAEGEGEKQTKSKESHALSAKRVKHEKAAEVA